MHTQGPACLVSNFAISGTGTCYANAALVQTRAYFEVVMMEKGRRGEGCEAMRGDAMRGVRLYTHAHIWMDARHCYACYGWMDG